MYGNKRHSHVAQYSAWNCERSLIAHLLQKLCVNIESWLKNSKIRCEDTKTKTMLKSQTGSSFSADVIRQISKPIDDLSVRAPGKYSVVEASLRRSLAAAYRLVDLFGWSEGIYNHITARTPDDYILLNPFGLLFHEVTASSLVKVDLLGNVIDAGSTNFGINNRGFTLHSAIHGARKDVACALHLHVPEVVAFTSLKRELLPLHQESSFVGPVAYHGYHGILTNLDEREEIVQSLGPQKMVMLLRNHGFVTCGATVEEAFYRAFMLIYAVRAQLKMTGVPQSEWNVPNDIQQTADRSYKAVARGEHSGIQWGPGELDWQAWMRVLDDMGLHTGYEYKLPAWRT